MAWGYLLIAGVLEIVWATAMKYSQGFSKVWPTVLTFSGGLASFYFLSLAVETLPLGTGYAVWTGIGAVGTAVLGIILFGESASSLRLLFIAMILLGVVGLRLTAVP